MGNLLDAKPKRGEGTYITGMLMSRILSITQKYGKQKIFDPKIWASIFCFFELDIPPNSFLTLRTLEKLISFGSLLCN